MLRRMAEVLLGSVKVRRTIPKCVGEGVVVANAKVGGLRYLFRSARRLDPVLFDVVQATVRPDDVVWDIGGNVGLYAAAAAGLAGRAGRIYSVEADRDAFSLLLQTAKAQPAGHAPINCLNVAVAKDCGVVNFNIAKRSRSSNFIVGFGSTQSGGVIESRLIPSLNLDVLLSAFSKPDVIKIDVEGAELVVLQELGPSEMAPWDTVGIPFESELSTRFSAYAV